MTETNILVVDDEKEIADLVEIYLVSDGFKVFKANSAEDGLKLIENEDIHLAILDIMMPGMDGLEMCKKIRETHNFPIILLSAKSADLDKILGLGTGADDYVTKPFNTLELTARVKSQLRRYTQLNPNSSVIDKDDPNEIRLKGMSINKDNHKVIIEGNEVKLTPIEFDILYLLASNAGRVFSTDEIFEKVWNEKVYEANNTVMVHIRRLRGKMNEDERGSFTELLHTKECGQVSVNISRPGITKGQHWHNSKWEVFIVVSGHGLIQERNINTGEKVEFEVSGDKIEAIYMIPGWTHNIINLSDTENLVTVMTCNEIFNPERPDTFFEPV